MVAVLPDTSWVEFRGLIHAKGLNPTTHGARVKFDDGTIHQCVVKIMEPHTPGLICEALGWILVNALGIPCPPKAAILLVPLPKFALHVAVPPWLQAYRTQSYPAWCSARVSGTSVTKLGAWGNAAGTAGCLAAAETRQVASFDVWTDNRDRNSGNVMLSDGGRYIAIDHETVLHDLLWVGIRNYVEKSICKEAKARLKPAPYNKFLDDVAKAADAHASALAMASTDLQASIQKIVDPTRSAKLWNDVHSYLAARSASGWVANSVGLVV